MTLALDTPRRADVRPQEARHAARSSEKLPSIPGLTGLRFFAAFSILFAHAVDWLAQFQDSNIREKFSFVAMYGMPLFFVLSGFVIHYNYQKLFISRRIARATCEFAAARFARLFPLYFFLLLMALFADNFLGKVNGNARLMFNILAYYGTLTQTWWYITYNGQSIIYWLFSVSWSISTEMYFYSAYVGVVFAILLLHRARFAILAALSYGALTTCGFILTRYYLSDIMELSQRHIPEYIDLGANFEHSYYRWLFYFSPYARVFEFFMGCLTAHAFMLCRKRLVGSLEQQLANILLAIALAALALFGALYLNVVKLGSLNIYIQHLALNFLCAPAIAVIMFYVGRYDTAFTRFLSAPPLVALGDTSYSIYLIHTWTLRIFLHPAPPWSVPWALDAVMRVVFAIGLTLLISHATYRLIEVPSRIWLRRKLAAIIVKVFSSPADSGRTAPDQSTDLPVIRAGVTNSRLAFSAAVILFLVSLAVTGQAARSDTVWRKLHRVWFGDRPEIAVESASYGLNCMGYAVPAPYVNTAKPGNATTAVKQACDETDRCEFVVDIFQIGDPVNGCGKDFSVEYKCTNSQAAKSAFISAEAYGKRVVLDCTTSR